ncbi:hypothetical protein WN943_014488 [Citrus x changshan-huyou]
MASSDTSNGMFAVGALQFSKLGTIYGLVQCTRDITTRECNYCWTGGLGNLKACCGSQQAITSLRVIATRNKIITKYSHQGYIYYSEGVQICVLYTSSSSGFVSTNPANSRHS